MTFFKQLKNEQYWKTEGSEIRFLDSCFDEVRGFVEHGSIKLNKSRILFRSFKKEKALTEFSSFKDLCLAFLDSLNSISDLVKSRIPDKRVEKIILATREIVEKTTKRNEKSTIPMPDIDYLRTDNITESDIDWVLKRMKNFWGKFLQIYGSVRIDMVLSNKSE